MEDQQVVFVELGDGGFEIELTAGDLQPLNQIGGAGEQNAPAVFNQREAESRRKVALAPPGGSCPHQEARTTVNWRRCSTRRRRRPGP